MSTKGYSYWRADETAADCEGCFAPFTMFNRRHHCRDCGGVFCAKCSSLKVNMPHRGHPKAERVCSLCHKFIAMRLLRSGTTAMDGIDTNLFLSPTRQDESALDAMRELENRRSKVTKVFRNSLHKENTPPTRLQGGGVDSNMSIFQSDAGMFSPQRDSTLQFLTKATTCAKPPGIPAAYPNTDPISLLTAEALHVPMPPFARMREALGNSYRLAIEADGEPLPNIVPFITRV